MGITSGFYNSINKDREYNAEQMSEIFDGVISDGVFEHIGSGFDATAISNNKIKIGSGKAWFDHKWIVVDDNGVTVSIPSITGLDSRIDVVFLEININEINRRASIKVQTGTPSETPVKPTLVNSSEVFKHALYYVTSNNNQIINIESVIGTGECPYSTYLLDTAKALYVYAGEEETTPRLPGQFENKLVDCGSFELEWDPSDSGDFTNSSNIGTMTVLGDSTRSIVCLLRKTVQEIEFTQNFENIPELFISFSISQNYPSDPPVENLLNINSTSTIISNSGARIDISFEERYTVNNASPSVPLVHISGVYPAVIKVNWFAIEKLS